MIQTLAHKIFRGWNASDWTSSDDRVRGGSSQVFRMYPKKFVSREEAPYDILPMCQKGSSSQAKHHCTVHAGAYFPRAV
jgi:hypothetical protein